MNRKQIIVTLKSLGWKLKRDGWHSGVFNGISLREAASLQGLESSENLGDRHSQKCIECSRRYSYIGTPTFGSYCSFECWLKHNPRPNKDQFLAAIREEPEKVMDFMIAGMKKKLADKTPEQAQVVKQADPRLVHLSPAKRMLCTQIAEAQAKATKARLEYIEFQQKADALKEQCRSHIFERVGDSTVCIICRTCGGWYCPKSKDHRCHYRGESEYCIHCKQPSERK